MADITISIPNSQAGRVVDALCAVGGYRGDSDDQPARREFARRAVADLIRRTVLQYEQREAATAAMAGVIVDPITVE